MKMQYKMPENAGELDRSIELACEAANTMKARVQRACVYILAHAEEHGDYTRAQVLVEGLGNGVNQSAVVEFFVRFGGLTVEKNAFSGWKGAEHIRANFQLAKDTMWFELKKQSPFKGYSLDADLLKVVKQHTAAKKALNDLPEGDEARTKYDMVISEATLNNVIQLCDFNVIGDDEVTATTDEEIEELEAALAQG